MNYLMAIVNALAGFVQRNPLTVLVLLILAVGAPALLKGLALFILYFFLGLVLLLLAGSLLLRWKMMRIRKQMEERFGQGFDGTGQGFDPRNFGGFGASRNTRNSGPQDRGRTAREGEVKVFRTAETPEKRVSERVGDYVDFEETKE